MGNFLLKFKMPITHEMSNILNIFLQNRHKLSQTQLLVP